MKYLKKFENSAIEHDVDLWCYNKCDKKDEILASVSTNIQKISHWIRLFRKQREEFRRNSLCRINFKITVDGKEISRLKELELIADTEKYNL